MFEKTLFFLSIFELLFFEQNFFNTERFCNFVNLFDLVFVLSSTVIPKFAEKCYTNFSSLQKSNISQNVFSF